MFICLNVRRLIEFVFCILTSTSVSIAVCVTDHLSRVMRKPDFCLCENKGADQLCSNCTADQRLCFRYLDSTIPFLLKSKISSFYPASVTVQAGLCRTWLDPKDRFSRVAAHRKQNNVIVSDGLTYSMEGGSG